MTTIHVPQGTLLEACMTCGAVTPADLVGMHRKWHERIEARRGWPPLPPRREVDRS